MNRKYLCLRALLIAGLLGMSACRRAKEPEPAPPKPTVPMVQQVHPDSFIVAWELRGDGPAVLELLNDAGDVTRTIDMQRNGVQCVATIDDVTPGATQEYRVRGTDGLTGEKLNFKGKVRTPALDCNAFRFEALGDSGGGGGFQLRVEWCMRQYDPELIIHTGDLVYLVGSKAEYPAKFFEPYHLLLPNVPFHPILGNHDVQTEDGQPMLDTFVLPENGPPGVQPERCYWFDYCNARFVGIDSDLDETTISEKVAPWLADVLAGAKTTWKFVYFHHAVYTNSTHEGNVNVRTYLAPVFEKYGVDISFSGHNHLYERSYPMLGGKVVSPGEGVVYITTGAGGMSKYAIGEAPHDFLAIQYDAKYSFTLVNVDGERLTLRQINDDNDVIDEWVYDKSKRPADAAATEAPVGEPATTAP